MSEWADQLEPINGDRPSFAETAQAVDGEIPRGATLDDLEAMTVADLRSIAADLEIAGRSKLNHDGLVVAIRDAR